MTLYTDIDRSCCAVLQARVDDGSLPAGQVLCADVRSLTAEFLAPFRHVHLFCGIGGTPLGLKWAGWPDEWSTVSGGFPCQDISSAGKGAGLEGERSGLFWELLRVVEIKRPLAVWAENVGALSARGLDRVAGALESLGYDVEALRVGAWAVGSPQDRERWWFVCVRSDVAVAGLPDQRCESRAGGEVHAAGSRRGRNQPSSGSEGSQLGDGSRQRKRRLPAGLGRPDEAEADAGWAGQGGELADAGCEREPDAEAGRGEAQTGVVAEAGSGSAVVQTAGQRLEGHRADAGQPQEFELGSTGDPGRWPHPRWCIVEDGKEKTVPSPQYDWEPPRIFEDTRSISARWRLALMGYPLGWLEVSAQVLDGLCRHAGVKQRRWWNKQGIAMTGNSQCPQNVAVLGRAFIEALKEAA